MTHTHLHSLTYFFYRFNHVQEVTHKNRSGNNSGSGGQLKDFEFARQELIRVQDDR